MKRKISTLALPLILTVCMALAGCAGQTASVSHTGGTGSPSSAPSEQAESSQPEEKPAESKVPSDSLSLSDIPDYSGSAYAVISDNVPDFTNSDLAEASASYERYGDLDKLGRCTTCEASVGRDIMPTKKRGSIGMIKPTGWHTVKYSWVDGKYLYNRCHLIGYQLTGENANEKNLITGTRYLNTEGMLPFENMVADYVKETGNHVLYRVTPVFDGDNLVAGGVHMEAQSVEDNGDGVQFNVYCYNVQPGVTIDYTDGSSSSDGTMGSGSGDSQEAENAQPSQTQQNTQDTQNTQSGAAPAQDNETAAGGTSAEQTYIVNTNTGKFHYPSCRAVKQMSEANKQTFTGSRDTLIAQGYQPCQICHS